MRRLFPITLAVVSAATTSAIGQQPTTATPAILGEPTGIHEDEKPTICVADVRVYETITVGVGRKEIEITLGSGVCDPSEPKITDVLIRFLDDDASGDVLIAKSCPALRNQVAKLRSARMTTSPDYGEVRNVRAGPFVITGRDLFDIRDQKGRTAAAHWIRQTLAAVQPCWNNFRQDQTRAVFRSLYAALELNP